MTAASLAKEGLTWPPACPAAPQNYALLELSRSDRLVPLCSGKPQFAQAAVMAELPSTNTVWKSIKPFVNGGASGMLATCVIQPIDMVKVRIQLGAQGSPLTVASNIIKQQGVSGLYSGLSAGLLRQATYTTARLGIFQGLSDYLKKANDGKPLPLWQKAAAGLTAGGLGALVGSPADLTLIRMQADATLPVESRRNYKGVGDAMVRIVKTDGAVGLFRGAGPTVVRAMALNMGMLASNDQAKEMLEAAGFAKNGQAVVLGGATIAGFFAAACSLPFDFVKTRIQKMEPLPDGTLPYKGPLDCAMKTFTKEGPLKFYTGFPTYCVRIAPHVAITLVMLEAIKSWEAKIGL
ncbi:g9461 [Coccomyxa elongata]